MQLILRTRNYIYLQENKIKTKDKRKKTKGTLRCKRADCFASLAMTLPPLGGWGAKNKREKTIE